MNKVHQSIIVELPLGEEWLAPNTLETKIPSHSLGL